jgi:acetylornithine deacetylase/succinyl-diaminopimelate desuccinylase-like protein
MTDERDVLEWLERAREDFVEFVLEFGNVPSPRGNEADASQFLAEWLHDRGLDARRQPVVGDRANVVATLEGTRDQAGADLIFNGHIDTAHGPAELDDHLEADQPRAFTEAWQDGPFLMGDGVANDKGPLAAQVFAALALLETGVDLGGNLHVTGTVGEIAGTTVGEYRDREQYAGMGLGTRHLVERGLGADYALVAECTGFAVAKMECGVAWFEIELSGSSTYHPRKVIGGLEDPADRADVVSDLVRTVQALEAWTVEYTERHTREYTHGTVMPVAGVGGIEAGTPQCPAAAPGTARIYLDVRLPPGETAAFARREVEAVLDGLPVDATIEPYLFRRGYVADDAVVGLSGPLVEAHESVRGGQPPRPAPHVTSMWRDSNVFNEAGIHSVNYGPPRAPEAFPDSGLSHAIRTDDLVAAAKVYALTAMEVCRE